jgi:para-aminobenzoate synthetase/4-amino-4-deoxychorismate lyase
MCARLARQQQPQRLRLLLARDGALQIQHSGLPPTASPQQLQLAAQPIDSGNVLLYHKTDQRAIYEAAESSASGGSEPLLYNGDGYITESTIANVVYQMQGQLYTPPVSDGLLPGTLRQHLIDRGLLQERSLPVASADRVDAWFLINALRGWRCAYLEPSSGPGT